MDGINDEKSKNQVVCLFMCEFAGIALLDCQRPLGKSGGPFGSVRPSGDSDGR